LCIVGAGNARDGLQVLLSSEARVDEIFVVVLPSRRFLLDLFVDSLLSQACQLLVSFVSFAQPLLVCFVKCCHLRQVLLACSALHLGAVRRRLSVVLVTFHFVIAHFAQPSGVDVPEFPLALRSFHHAFVLIFLSYLSAVLSVVAFRSSRKNARRPYTAT
jgi:hypothetical protein